MDEARRAHSWTLNSQICARLYRKSDLFISRNNFLLLLLCGMFHYFIFSAACCCCCCCALLWFIKMERKKTKKDTSFGCCAFCHTLEKLWVPICQHIVEDVIGDEIVPPRLLPHFIRSHFDRSQKIQSTFFTDFLCVQKRIWCICKWVHRNYLLQIERFFFSSRIGRGTISWCPKMADMICMQFN